MAKAIRQLSLPAESRTLGEIVRNLVGPTAWPLLLQMTGEGERPIRFYSPGRIYLSSDPAGSLGIATDNPQPYIAAVKACLPLLDRWGAELVATGSRGDPLAPTTEIAPPGLAGWRVVILSLTYSIIQDPAGAEKWNGPKIYDLRFTRREAELTGAAVWAVPEAKRLTAAGKIAKNISKTDFAKRLAAAPENAKSADPVDYRHILNKLLDWRIWPINSLK